MSPREGSQDVVLMVEVVDGVEASLSLSRSSLSLLLPEGHHRWRGVTVVKAVKALLMRFQGVAVMSKRRCIIVVKEVQPSASSLSLSLLSIVFVERSRRCQSSLLSRCSSSLSSVVIAFKAISRHLLLSLSIVVVVEHCSC